MSTRTATAPAPAAEDEPPKRGRQAMLRAVNRDLRALPGDLATTALAELARQLARRFDDGDTAATAQLRGVLSDLRREARTLTPAPAARPAGAAETTPAAAGDHEPAGGAGAGSTLDAIRSQRAVRRGGRRPDRTPAAADMDGPGPGS